MRQPVILAHGSGRQNGLALASVLAIMIVLTILGSAVFRNVGTDITHSGKTMKRVRAEFAAESAVQWGLVELSRARTGKLPFTLATHESDGETRLREASEEDAPAGPWPLRVADFTNFPGGQIGMDEEGWAYMTGKNREKTLSGGKEELLSFKAWYPNDTTLRMTGRAVVEGAQAQLELESHFRKVPAPL